MTTEQHEPVLLTANKVATLLETRKRVYSMVERGQLAGVVRSAQSRRAR